MYIRLLQAWADYRYGTRFDCSDDLAKDLIERGIAEPIEKSADAPQRDKSVKRSSVRRKRKKAVNRA